ncbi:MAG: LysR family transcriptional regulator [Gemmataceae bacterium]|nr:LysR family transcriptional regulator [Gemmataceae bacterium]
MEIHQLEYLVAVAEEGSFTKAAERSSVAQPSLSQQIKKLEREVGQPLFDRLPRGVVPTEAGQRLLERARRILAELRDAKRQVGELRDQVAGRLIVGAIPTIAPFLLPTVTARFLRRFPAVSLEVIEDVTARLLAMLERGDVDLALVSSAHPPRGILLETIGVEPLLLLTATKHPLARTKNVTWEQLEGEPFLVLHEMHCLAGQVQRFCKSHGVEPCVSVRGVHLATLAAMVSSGLGVSVVPAMMQSCDHDKSRVYRPFVTQPPSRDLCIATATMRYRTNAARAFMTTVKQAVPNLARQPSRA